MRKILYTNATDAGFYFTTVGDPHPLQQPHFFFALSPLHGLCLVRLFLGLLLRTKQPIIIKYEIENKTKKRKINSIKSTK